MILSKKMKDISGQSYGSLTAVAPMRLSKFGTVIWQWQCKCGNTHEATAIQIKAVAKQATNPEVPSCGCVKIARAIEVHTKHGMSRTPLHAIWQAMKQRCYNPKHKLYYMYGGKGVTICDEWLNSFESFAQWAEANGWSQGKHIDKDISSDRQNVSRSYGPDTCLVMDGFENVRYSSSRNNYANNPKLQIRPDQVPEIKALYLAGTKQRDIAEMYSVSQASIWRILHKS